MPEPGPGEFRVRVEYVSLDPAMRGWINEGKSYVPPVGIGEVMRGYAAGIVEKSNNPAFKVGDAVQGAVRRAEVRHLQRRARRQGRHVAGAAAALDRRPRHAGLDRLLRPARGRPAQGRRDRGGVGGLGRGRLGRRARSPRSRAAAPSASPAGPTSAATSRRSSASTPASTTRPASWPPTSRPPAPRASTSTSRTSAARSSTPCCCR